MADNKPNIIAIVLTGIVTGGFSAASTWYMQRQEFAEQRAMLRQGFQGTLVSDNLDQFVAACVTEDANQKTVFMVRLAEAAQCEDSETQTCVINYIRENCRRFVSAEERALVEEQVAMSMQTTAAAPQAEQAPAAEAPAAGAAQGRLQQRMAQRVLGPRLYIHVPNADWRARMTPLAQSGELAGVRVLRGIETIENYDGATHVRYFREEDRDEAVALIAALQPTLPDISTEPRLIGGYDSPRVAGQLELWVGPATAQ